MARPPRYEFKIPCPPTLLPEVEAWVRLHPAHWRVAYPPRQVNSLYFDSFAYRSLGENLNGVGRRQKLRLRWYGLAGTCVQAAHWELKCKVGLVGWKELEPWDGELDLRTAAWSGAWRAGNVTLPARVSVWLTAFSQPVLLVQYRRAYYETPDGVLRLTLDTELRVYDQRFSARPNVRCPALVQEALIVELKAPATLPAHRRLAQVLADFPWRADRYSKYVSGMLAAPDFERMAGA